MIRTTAVPQKNHVRQHCWKKQTTLLILAIFLPVFLFTSTIVPVHAAEVAQDTTSLPAFAGSTAIAIAFMLSILVLKITAFVLGYLIVRLGHDTLVKGISGEIDFGFSGSGITTKLKSGSPGALFVLMGAAIIIWGLTVQKPMEIKIVPVSSNVVSQQAQADTAPLHKATVPD